MTHLPPLATTFVVLSAALTSAAAQPAVPEVGNYDPKTDVNAYSPPRPTPPAESKPTVIVVGPDGKPVAEAPPAETGVYHYDDVDTGDDEDDELQHAGPTPELHVVRRGDTLWDLCSYYFNDPWQWPKIWSYNPQITNPHWIYPSDLVRLLPKGLLATMRLDDAQLEPETEAGAAAPAPAQVPSRPLDLAVRQLAFVDRNQLDASMRVIGAVEGKALLAAGDEIYVDYPSRVIPKVGARYSIYAEERSVVHPTSGDEIGSYVRILGEIELLSVKQDKHARARIVESNHEIERGARIGPVTTTFRSVAPTRNEVDVQGTVVAMLTDTQLIGEGSVVFVDLGKAKGVKPGNRLFVVRRGDAMAPERSTTQLVGQNDGDYPVRALGEIVLIEVGSSLSVGLVTLSAEEMGVGDRVMMREQ